MSNLNLQKLREWVWPWPWTFKAMMHNFVWAMGHITCPKITGPDQCKMLLSLLMKNISEYFTQLGGVSFCEIWHMWSKTAVICKAYNFVRVFFCLILGDR